MMMKHVVLCLTAGVVSGRRLVERLENMRRSAVGNGLSQCLLCGEVLGLLGAPSVLCQDCCKVKGCARLPKGIKPHTLSLSDVMRQVHKVSHHKQ